MRLGYPPRPPAAACAGHLEAHLTLSIWECGQQEYTPALLSLGTGHFPLITVFLFVSCRSQFEVSLYQFVYLVMKLYSFL